MGCSIGGQANGDLRRKGSFTRRMPAGDLRRCVGGMSCRRTRAATWEVALCGDLRGTRVLLCVSGTNPRFLLLRLSCGAWQSASERPASCARRLPLSEWMGRWDELNALMGGGGNWFGQVRDHVLFGQSCGGDKELLRGGLMWRVKSCVAVQGLRLWLHVSPYEPLQLGGSKTTATDILGYIFSDLLFSSLIRSSAQTRRPSRGKRPGSLEKEKEKEKA